MKNKKMPKKITAKSIYRYLRKTNLIIYIIVLGCGLVGYVIVLDNILQKATSDSVIESSIKSTFDQTTINKINQLKTSTDNTEPQVPNGRVNPFSE
ncbi:hypothetical protein HGB24_02130 [Candidatus Saccharibacteria bacterium]|nr:hypothetical protein [Candidatus Saccharibacteria bacterium]